MKGVAHGTEPAENNRPTQHRCKALHSLFRQRPHQHLRPNHNSAVFTRSTSALELLHDTQKAHLRKAVAPLHRAPTVSASQHQTVLDKKQVAADCTFIRWVKTVGYHQTYMAPSLVFLPPCGQSAIGATLKFQSQEFMLLFASFIVLWFVLGLRRNKNEPQL